MKNTRTAKSQNDLQEPHLRSEWSDGDVGNMMLLTSLCWWPFFNFGDKYIGYIFLHVDDIRLLMLAPWIFTDTFGLQYPLPLDVTIGTGDFGLWFVSNFISQKNQCVKRLNT